MSKRLLPSLLAAAAVLGHFFFAADGSRLSDDEGRDQDEETTAHQDTSGDSHRVETAGYGHDYDYGDVTANHVQDHAGEPNGDAEGETREDDGRRLEDEASSAHKREEKACIALGVARKDEKDCQDKVRCAEREMDRAQKKANEADEKVLKTLAHRMADRIQTFETRKSEETRDCQDRDGRFVSRDRDDRDGIAAGLSHELENDHSLELLLKEARSHGRPSAVTANGLGGADLASRGGAEFDCQSGLTTWQTGWSDYKKSWCCSHERLGCADGIGMAAVGAVGAVGGVTARGGVGCAPTGLVQKDLSSAAHDYGSDYEAE